MSLSPIILIVYNRPEHTKKTIEALKSNTLASKSILYIYSDAPKREEDEKKVKQVRELIHNIEGFREIYVIERERNFGLANNIIEGISELLSKFDKVIEVEDDFLTSPEFLTYMNYFLDKYRNNGEIFSISGFNYPKTVMKIPSKYEYDVYFSERAGAWGFATWRNRWNKVDWEVQDFDKFLKNKSLQRKFNEMGEDRTDMLKAQMAGLIDSFAIRWDYAHFKNNKYCIFPIRSYVENIGMDGTGTHWKASSRLNQIEPLSNKTNWRIPNQIIMDKEIKKSFIKVFKQRFLKHVSYKIIKSTLLYKIYKRYKKK